MALFLLLFSPLLLVCCYLLIFLRRLLLGTSYASRHPFHGPKTFPLIGCLISFYKNRHRLLDWYTELLAESPLQTIVVCRLGARRTIITANPENIEYMLKTNFHNYPKGEPFTDILGDLLGHGIFNVDGELWHAQRKLVSHEFTTRSVREFVVKTLESEAFERLLPILESAALNHRVVDLQELLRRFTFDTICKLSLGTDPGCLQPSLPVSILARAFDMASGIIARRGAAPMPAVWKAKRTLGIGSERRLKEEIKLIHDCIEELIQSRKKELRSKEKSDFLSRLISCGYDEEMIRDMVISFIMAGRDTTSSALTWFLWLLSHHREIEREIVNEVLEMEEENFDFESLKKLKLLKAGLCESMRLYPPVAWDSKHAANEDALPKGPQIKKGDRVTYFPYGMGRMKRVWGEDCHEFKPQRWLASEETVSPFKFPIFQAGPRVCLGKEMAFLQMKCVAAAILRRYELLPVDDRRPVFIPLLTAHMGDGFNVLVRKRMDPDSLSTTSSRTCEFKAEV